VWFSWCTKMDRITAFRCLGICTDMLRPDLVNRKYSTGAVLTTNAGAAAGAAAGATSAAAAPTSTADPAASADGSTPADETGGRARMWSSVASAPPPPNAGFYMTDKPPPSPQPPIHLSECLTPDRGPASRRGTLAYYKHKAEERGAMLAVGGVCAQDGGPSSGGGGATPAEATTQAPLRKPQLLRDPIVTG